ncbi:MAG: Ty1/Copia family ribonuclease HI [Pseudomonadota bacterium]
MFVGNNEESVIAYADASWASDQDTGRSVTGYVIVINGTSVSWKSQRQPTVAMSSTEAEYMALFAVTQEVIWLRRLLKQVKSSSSSQASGLPRQQTHYPTCKQSKSTLKDQAHQYEVSFCARSSQ